MVDPRNESAALSRISESVAFSRINECAKRLALVTSHCLFACHAKSDNPSCFHLSFFFVFFLSLSLSLCMDGKKGSRRKNKIISSDEEDANDTNVEENDLLVAQQVSMISSIRQRSKRTTSASSQQPLSHQTIGTKLKAPNSKKRSVSKRVSPILALEQPVSLDGTPTAAKESVPSQLWNDKYAPKMTVSSTAVIETVQQSHGCFY